MLSKGKVLYRKGKKERKEKIYSYCPYFLSPTWCRYWRHLRDVSWRKMYTIREVHRQSCGEETGLQCLPASWCTALEEELDSNSRLGHFFHPPAWLNAKNEWALNILFRFIYGNFSWEDGSLKLAFLPTAISCGSLHIIYVVFFLVHFFVDLSSFYNHRSWSWQRFIILRIILHWTIWNKSTTSFND